MDRAVNGAVDQTTSMRIEVKSVISLGLETIGGLALTGLVFFS